MKPQVVVNTAQTIIWVKKLTLSSNIESQASLAPFWMYHYYSLILKQTGDTTCIGVIIIWVMAWLGKWQRWYWPSQRKIIHIFQREKINGINFMGLWASVSLLWLSSFLYKLFERFIRERLTLSVPCSFSSTFNLTSGIPSNKLNLQMENHVSNYSNSCINCTCFHLFFHSFLDYVAKYFYSDI